MKTKFTTLALVTVTALSLAPRPAVANDKGLAIVGGFIGGLIVGSAINDNHHDRNNTRTTVIIKDRPEHRRESGYWQEVRTRVWVSGYWIVERRPGRDYRRYVPGHYEHRTDRRWVSYDRSDRDDRHDHHDRDVSYGYASRR